ncbi:hypothetical protein [Paenisporosarcina indica]|nr:hypothetical protein [Paenisporosarcina indica]
MLVIDAEAAPQSDISVVTSEKLGMVFSFLLAHAEPAACANV